LTNQALGNDGVAAVQYLATFSDVDPTRLGIIGWSMGGGTALQIASRLSPADGLKSVVLVGANLNFNK
jgi:dienelactone hydrolase